MAEETCGLLHVSPPALGHLSSILPSSIRITGSRDCHGVCLLAIEGANIKPGQHYLAIVNDNADLRQRTINVVESD